MYALLLETRWPVFFVSYLAIQSVNIILKDHCFSILKRALIRKLYFFLLQEDALNQSLQQTTGGPLAQLGNNIPKNESC